MTDPVLPLPLRTTRKGGSVTVFLLDGVLDERTVETRVRVMRVMRVKGGA